MTVTRRVDGRLSDVRAFYATGEQISIPAPSGTTGVRVEHCRGTVVTSSVRDGAAVLPLLSPGTYVIEALDASGALLAEEVTTVAAHPGERGVHAFATSFSGDGVAETLSWLTDLRATVVQVYDWMHEYAAPLGEGETWADPSGRPVSLTALQTLSAGIRCLGGVVHAYAPIYALDRPFASEHPEWLLYRNDGEAQGFLDSIVLADPGNPEWQRHFADVYGQAADRIGFNGFHIDTYGYPRAPQDRGGRPIDLLVGYEEFLAELRRRRASDMISFNQVNGVPAAVHLPPGPGFRYCEVWPPNDLWRHLEGLLDRSAGVAGRLASGASPGGALRGTLACYPPVWRGGAASRRDRLRTVLFTEAVATMLGASALLYGDRGGVLCDPYYPNYEALDREERETILDWHRFALRHRDLFLEGEDTSWCDVGDENGAVSIHADVPVRPEPVGGTVFARVVRNPRCIAVGLLDLSGAAAGSWAEPAEVGRCRSVSLDVLLDEPPSWRAAVAEADGHGTYRPVAGVPVATKQGVASRLEVPLGTGWTILRFLR